MKTPAFWSQPPGAWAALLWPFGWLYGAVTSWRMRRSGIDAGIPVICIGNFTAGGAGKTPTALHIARLALAAGAKPFFLSRGYGGQLAGPVVVDLEAHGPEACGDEPLLLAATAPCIVARDRVAGARLAADLGADIIIMDDGMQNPALRKSCVLAVVDGASGIGNGLCLPAGPLRAPLAAQMQLVDAVVVISDGKAGRDVASVAEALARPVLRATLAPREADVATLRGKALLAFAGIGRPAKFAQTLREAGLDVRDLREFPDHHRYSPEDLQRLQNEAKVRGLTLVTTEKDAVKLPENSAIHVVGVTLIPDDAAAARLAAMISGQTPYRP